MPLLKQQTCFTCIELNSWQPRTVQRTAQQLPKPKPKKKPKQKQKQQHLCFIICFSAEYKAWERAQAKTLHGNCIYYEQRSHSYTAAAACCTFRRQADRTNACILCCLRRSLSILYSTHSSLFFALLSFIIMMMTPTSTLTHSHSPALFYCALVGQLASGLRLGLARIEQHSVAWQAGQQKNVAVRGRFVWRW